MAAKGIVINTSINKNGAGRIVWLDVARCIAIVSITLNHAVNRSYRVYGNTSVEFSAIPMASTLFKTVVYVFSRIGVPLFLMITGSLILKKRVENADDVKRFYKKSFLPLFITSEIWMALFFVFLVLTDPGSRRQSLILTAKSFVCTMFQIEPLTMGSMWYIPMILCLYLFLPYMAMAKGKVGVKNILVPGGAILFYNFLLPSANRVLQSVGHDPLIKSEDIVILTEYLLYVVIGYLISTDLPAKMKTATVAAGAAFWFAFGVAVQLYYFRSPAEVILRYDSVVILLCSVFLFELLRRIGGRVKNAGFFASLSRMAFGVFFLHILVMETLCMEPLSVVKTVLPPPLFLIYLETVSFLSAVAGVWLINRIPRVGKWLFLYK